MWQKRTSIEFSKLASIILPCFHSNIVIDQNVRMELCGVNPIITFSVWMNVMKPQRHSSKFPVECLLNLTIFTKIWILNHPIHFAVCILWAETFLVMETR